MSTKAVTIFLLGNEILVLGITVMCELLKKRLARKGGSGRGFKTAVLDLLEL